MANYRTLKELTPYKGYGITRVHKNGDWFYYACKNSIPVTECLETRSLKEIKRKISREIKEVANGNN